MPLAVAFSPPDVFVVRATGNVTYSECQRAINDVLALRSDTGTRKLLVDARGVITAPNTEELRMLARDMQQFIQRGYGSLAIVSDRAFVYGVARMFAVFAEAFGMHVRAFQTVDEAAQWLATESDSPAV